MKRLAVAIPALLLAACGSATHTTASTVTQTGTAQPTITQTAGSTPPRPTSPNTVVNSFGIPLMVINNDGTYLVNVEIPPGKYRNTGGAMCYWARLRGPDKNDIIESKKTGDPQVVEVRASDTAFLTQNCGTWQMIPPF